MKLFYGILITFILLSSCSKDDNNVTNGFTLNGTFYTTNFARSANNTYSLIFFNSLNSDDIIEGQFGLFSLIYDSDGNPLAKGTYSTKNGPYNAFGIDGYRPIEFFGDSEEGSVYTHWYQNKNFKSGTVTMNSISTTSDGLSNQVTEIDVDYVFQWNEITVKGHYSGKVMPN